MPQLPWQWSQVGYDQLLHIMYSSIIHVARVEQQSYMMGFSHTLVPLHIDSKMSLDEVTRKVSSVPMGGTDCALPMIHAKEKNLNVDVFIVYTDSETWYGHIHPSEALREYRKV